MESNVRKMTKREFLHSGLCGVCGIALGLGSLDVLGRSLCDQEMDLPFAGDDELWKWSKEGYHYIQTPKGIKCLTCPNECEINAEKKAECRNHIVVGNKLYTIAYGNPCAVHVDPIEKKPLNHFLPGSTAYSIATAGCNLKCLNCQNWSISQVGPKETQNYDLMPPQVISECLARGCESIAYTYSEPVTFYEYMYDTSLLAREKGIRNIMVTAGYINEKPLRKLCGVIDAANVDLKSFSDELYMMLNSGKLQPVLTTLKIMKEMGVWLEITNLIVPTWTDDMDMIKEMCGWLVSNGFDDTPLHFSRFYPQYQLANLPPTPQSVLTQARDIAVKEGLKFVYIGNIPGDPGSNTSCPVCRKLLMERRGYTIAQNNIVNSRCKFCGVEIAGVWE